MSVRQLPLTAAIYDVLLGRFAVGRPHQVLPLSATTHMPTGAYIVSQLLRHELAFLTESLGVARP